MCAMIDRTVCCVCRWFTILCFICIYVTRTKPTGINKPEAVMGAHIRSSESSITFQVYVYIYIVYKRINSAGYIYI